jgi:hypothetical protein
LDNDEALQEIKHQLSEIKISAAKKSPVSQATIVCGTTNDVINHSSNNNKPFSLSARNSINLSSESPCLASIRFDFF